MSSKKPKSNENPVILAALEAATAKIEGFEQGVDTYNEIAAYNLRHKRDPAVINQTRVNRRNIAAAKQAVESLKGK